MCLCTYLNAAFSWSPSFKSRLGGTGCALCGCQAALINYCLLTLVDGVCGGVWVSDARTGQGGPGRLCKVAKVQEEQRLPDTRPSVGASRRVLDVLDVLDVLEQVVTVRTVGCLAELALVNRHLGSNRT